MVIGFEVFREAFKGYEDCYTIIGGTACDILMNKANLDFRATRDIDMILLIENRFEESGEVLWKFIKDGAYRCGWKSSEKMHFYRFTEPQNPNYPIMIELFSKDPGYELHEGDMVITSLHISDEVSSLSAIMLNDDYYEFMMSGRKVVNGVGVLGAEHLIPFKMRAWLDLCRRKNEGEHVNSGDIKKHKNDVFRLAQLITANTRQVLSPEIAEDMKKFLSEIADETVDLKSLGIRGTDKKKMTEMLYRCYGLKDNT